MKLRLNWTIARCLLIAGAFAVACSGGGEESPSASLKVVTSTGLLADIVSNVAGDSVSIEGVIPANADAHTFSLTPGDARKIANADLVVLIGADFSAAEGEIKDLARGSVLSLADQVPLEPFQDGGGTDPHFWLNPQLVAAAVDSIVQALSAADPAGSDGYAERAATYKVELAALDAELWERFATGEDGVRPSLVTFHDAFGYLARRYDLEIVGFVVEGPEEDPSASDIANLVKAMKRIGATIVFKEPQFNARVVEQVAEAAGAEIRDLPSATLTQEYPTYLDLMRAVGAAIVQ